MDNVYHDGERTVQQMAGESLMAEKTGRVIKNAIISGAINFIEKQPMVVVGSINREKEVWASLIIGDFGFTKVVHPSLLSFDRNRIKSNPGDVVYNNADYDRHLGLLFIELDSRKRYRINGPCLIDDTKLEVAVREAYPNCPKYIQRRIISSPEHFEPIHPTTSEGHDLTEAQKNWIVTADTFFVASGSDEGMLDASHRGGKPGFVEILDDATLKIPDYSGNSLYNTLGNIVQQPNVGLLFIDFEKGKTLQLTGNARLLFNQASESDLQKTGGTGRFWLFQTTRWLLTENHHKINWNFLEYSPFNP